MPNERQRIDRWVGVGGDGGGTQRADYLALVLDRLEHEYGAALCSIRKIRVGVDGASVGRRRAIALAFCRFLTQQSEVSADYAEVMRDLVAAMTVELARR